MEIQCTTSSPGMGNSQLKCEQDFRHGVKVSFPQYPAPMSPPSSTIFNEQLYDWMEATDLLGSEHLEAFTDVILPEVENFEVDDLFPDIPNCESVKPVLNSVTPFQPANQTDATLSTSILQQKQTDDVVPIIIKLKKVKHTTKFETPLILTNSGSHIEIYNYAALNIDNLHEDAEIMYVKESLSPIHLYESSPTPSSPSESLTLKNVLDMDNADFILDSYLSPNSSTSPNNTIEWESECSTLDLLSHTLSSPSTLSGYSDEDTSGDIGLSDMPKVNYPVRRRQKKVREKASIQMRYLRKKQQNKQAASRYRIKKKIEQQHIHNLFTEEEQRNADLTKNYKELKQEIAFIKKFLREILIAKKIVSPDTFD